MSAGAFEISRYEAQYGAGDQRHPIKVQPETELADIGGITNTPPVGSVTNPISAQVTRGNRQLGLRPRKITLRLPATGVPAGYTPSGIVVIPALNVDFYNAATPGTVVTYLGVDCVVISRTPESTR